MFTGLTKAQSGRSLLRGDCRRCASRCDGIEPARRRRRRHRGALPRPRAGLRQAPVHTGPGMVRLCIRATLHRHSLMDRTATARVRPQSRSRPATRHAVSRPDEISSPGVVRELDALAQSGTGPNRIPVDKSHRQRVEREHNRAGHARPPGQGDGLLAFRPRSSRPIPPSSAHLTPYARKMRGQARITVGSAKSAARLYPVTASDSAPPRAPLCACRLHASVSIRWPCSNRQASLEPRSLVDRGRLPASQSPLACTLPRRQQQYTGGSRALRRLRVTQVRARPVSSTTSPGSFGFVLNGVAADELDGKLGVSGVDRVAHSCPDVVLLELYLHRACDLVGAVRVFGGALATKSHRSGRGESQRRRSHPNPPAVPRRIGGWSQAGDIACPARRLPRPPATGQPRPATRSMISPRSTGSPLHTSSMASTCSRPRIRPSAQAAAVRPRPASRRTSRWPREALRAARPHRAAAPASTWNRRSRRATSSAGLIAMTRAAATRWPAGLHRGAGRLPRRHRRSRGSRRNPP